MLRGRGFLAGGWAPNPGGPPKMSIILRHAVRFKPGRGGRLLRGRVGPAATGLPISASEARSPAASPPSSTRRATCGAPRRPPRYTRQAPGRRPARRPAGGSGSAGPSTKEQPTHQGPGRISDPGHRGPVNRKLTPVDDALPSSPHEGGGGDGPEGRRAIGRKKVRYKGAMSGQSALGGTSPAHTMRPQDQGTSPHPTTAPTRNPPLGRGQVSALEHRTISFSGRRCAKFRGRAGSAGSAAEQLNRDRLLDSFLVWRLPAIAWRRGPLRKWSRDLTGTGGRPGRGGHPVTEQGLPGRTE